MTVNWSQAMTDVVRTGIGDRYTSEAETFLTEDGVPRVNPEALPPLENEPPSLEDVAEVVSWAIGFQQILDGVARGRVPVEGLQRAPTRDDGLAIRTGRDLLATTLHSLGKLAKLRRPETEGDPAQETVEEVGWGIVIKVMAAEATEAGYDFRPDPAAYLLDMHR